MSSLNLAVIGNCQIGALLDDRARIVWACLPQFDSDPAFCRLLMNDEAETMRGRYDIDLIDYERSEQSYIRNTAIVQTTLYDTHGGAVRITDFASQDPKDPGVLVLSNLAGAAQELTDAVLVNPYDIDGVADGIHRALRMPLGERKERYDSMIAVLRKNDITAWRTRFVDTLIAAHEHVRLVS